jgi:hypothetical protein
VRGLCCAGLRLFFDGEWQAFRAVEDFANDVEDKQEECSRSNAHDEIQVAMNEVPDGVDEGWAEPDGEQRADQELRELAAEDGKEKGNGLHLEDTGGELEELERGGRREHGRDHDGEELLALEAVADALVAFAVDALEEKELAAGATDEEGDERADGGSHGGDETVDQKAVVVSGDVADDDAVHGDRNGDQCGVDEGEAGDAPDAEWFEDQQQGSRELM